VRGHHDASEDGHTSRGARTQFPMVHGMDAMSKKWRDDPVRAALEKKQNREAAADRMAKANAMASEILQKRLAAAGASSSSMQAAEEEDSAAMNDADYRKLLERQRNKLMDGNDSDSSSSNISVFDPFQSRHVLMPDTPRATPRVSLALQTPPSRCPAALPHSCSRSTLVWFGSPSSSSVVLSLLGRKERKEEKAERKDRDRKREKEKKEKREKRDKKHKKEKKSKKEKKEKKERKHKREREGDDSGSDSSSASGDERREKKKRR
jgi:hypothetical protein